MIIKIFKDLNERDKHSKACGFTADPKGGLWPSHFRGSCIPSEDRTNKWWLYLRFYPRVPIGKLISVMI